MALRRKQVKRFIPHPLERHAEGFFQLNPDIERIVLTRPAPERPRRYFEDSNAESFHLMPESCPILRGIIDALLNDLTEERREQLFNRIFNDVTNPFRTALNNALNDKHRLMRSVERRVDELQTTLKSVKLERPEEEQNAEENTATFTIVGDSRQAYEEDDDE